METNEMLHAGIFLNANFFLSPHEEKDDICNSGSALESEVFSFIYTKKEHQGHSEKLSFLLSLSSHLVALALASACLGWQQIDVPQAVWGIKFQDVLTGSNLKGYLVNPVLIIEKSGT